MPRSGGQDEKVAFVTLLTQSAYLPGTLVLIHSLRRHGCQYPIVCLVTAKVNEMTKRVLRHRDITIREVDELHPDRKESNGEIQGILKEERFRDTWTKLMVFSCTEFDRVVFLDSDILIRRNCDELASMELDPGWIAASHACTCNPFRLSHYPSSWIPKNCAFSAVKHPQAMTNPVDPNKSDLSTHKLLNSGVFVLRPSVEEHKAQKHLLDTDPSIPDMIFPDQDFLALRFRNRWKSLGWQYNGLKTLASMHAGPDGCWRADEVKVVHYILSPKPWNVDRKDRMIGSRTVNNRDDTNVGSEQTTAEGLVDWWWDEFHLLKSEWNPSDTDHDWGYLLSQMATVY